MRTRLVLSLLALPAFATAAFTPGPYVLERVYPTLSFSRPVDMREAPDGSGRLFILERTGKIFSFTPTDQIKTLVMDLTSVVGVFRDDALMSIAFDPDFVTNGYFYLHYSRASIDTTIPSPNRVSRFQFVPANAATCDMATERVVLEQPTVYRDHKGGTIAFGPDGYLYIAFGDGGSKTGTPAPPDDPLPGTDPASQDVFHTAQDRTKLLGKVLRIDVRPLEDGSPAYRIPADNPFVSEAGVRGEIWAYGFRNPWRMAFDPASGRLLVADVGWKQFDEISHVVPGGNYGWSMMEGTACFPPDATCTPADYVAPLWVRSFPSVNNNLSITGGYFSTTTRLPNLQGTYVYADYIQGDVYAMRYDGTTAEVAQLVPSPGAFQFPIAGFGLDASGDVYVLQFNNGGVYRLILDPNATPTPTPSTTPSPTPTPVPPTPTPTPIPPTATPSPTPTTPSLTATPSPTPTPAGSPTPTPYPAFWSVN